MAPISRNSRAGFTLVELLVVIVIISMLIALLIPAVTGARARARQTECSNNQRNLAQAIQQYEMAKKRFPGYVKRLDTNTPPTMGSWIVSLFKYLGRNDLARTWLTNPATASAEAEADGMRLDVLVCPADEPTESSPLSYVVNCGMRDAEPDTNLSPIPPTDWGANGVFHNHYTYAQNTSPRAVYVALADISDGAQHTLMLSENIQAHSWLAADWAKLQGGNGNRESAAAGERFGGFLWENQDPPTTLYRINQERDADSSDPEEIQYARPSSYHPSGVVVSYCDGHQGTLSEEMDYLPYCLLMTPNGSGARLPGSNTTVEPPFTNRKLDAEMIK